MARENPFTSERVERLGYVPLHWTWEEMMFRLDEMGYRGAIVGPEGSGKTTLLLELDRRLKKMGFETAHLRLTAEQPNFLRGQLRKLFSEITEKHIILFDGAEQLSRFAWWRFKGRSRKAGGLIITAHRDGLLPELVYALTTPDLLEKLLRQLLGQSYGYYNPNPTALFNRHQGNIRNALREFYDRAAAIAPPPVNLPRAS